MMNIGLALVTLGFFLSGMIVFYAAYLNARSIKPSVAKSSVLASVALFLLTTVGAMAMLSFGTPRTLSPQEKGLFLWGPGVSWLGFVSLFASGLLFGGRVPDAGTAVPKGIRIALTVLVLAAYVVVFTVFIIGGQLARLYQWDSLWRFSQSGMATYMMFGAVALLMCVNLLFWEKIRKGPA